MLAPKVEHHKGKSILSTRFPTNYLNKNLRQTRPAPLMRYIYTDDARAFSERVKNHLRKTITTSKRRGTWFSLNRTERSILYLATRLELKFSSLDLLRALTSILKKLEQHGETLYAWLQRGIKLAWAFSEFAVVSGNKSARSGRNDRSYAVYLGQVFSNGTRGRSAR
jgi:hypothetical protein